MYNKRLKIAISPCPNDTFIFGGMATRMTGPGIAAEIEWAYRDIQELNQLSLGDEYDVIKISAAQLPNVLDRYRILPAGAALGFDCGPLLIARKHIPLEDLNDKTIALPGNNTTAAFLFRHLFPGARNTVQLLFSEIESALLAGDADAGVIIHETRFSYAGKGLVALADLGKLWHEATGLPIPLGLIAVRKGLEPQLIQDLIAGIRSSIHYAREHFAELLPFIQGKAIDLDEQVIRQHIGLYVNDYSLDLDLAGREAIMMLLKTLSGTQNDAN
ncbi:MAG TPA: 1,4-dihydroxy-6-naphthoate synthase, partial [Saprospiraceae bacterium]|nr:1,4-dihydroxy-6-naphthoate synthase [Saprospiraceae bacterium]